MVSSSRARCAVAAALLATSACAGANAVVPASSVTGFAGALAAPRAVDGTSILKSLTKTVLIGSTVDPKNGDQGPHGLAIVPYSTGKLKKGQLVACNFTNKSGTAGAGTTVEALDAAANSKPSQFAENAAFKGCGSLAVNGGSTVFGTAFAGKSLAQFDPTGAYSKIAGASIVAPLAIDYAKFPGPYGSLVLFASDAATGTVMRLDTTNGAPYPVTVIATGFGVNKKAGTAALAACGLQYNAKTDTLYIVDGVNNTVVAFKTASKILLKDAIAVQPGGKTFKYANQQPPVASVVYAGSALKSPVASALLPNGNLIVANGSGNALVEISSAGQVLATKVVDTKSTPAVFGLVASGTSDTNTVLYYTDYNTNSVELLTR